MEKNEEYTLTDEREEENIPMGEDVADRVDETDEPVENIGEAEASREEYNRLIKTKYKDFYTEDTQRMINRRFKQYKLMEERLKALESRSEALPKSPVSREIIEQEIGKHTDEICKAYPEFKLDEAISSDTFISLARVALESGQISLTQAYRLAYFDSIMAKEIEKAQKETEQRVTDSIRARRSRPSENAIAPRQERRAVDISSLTREERAALALRASKGEKIKL